MPTWAVFTTHVPTSASSHQQLMLVPLMSHGTRRFSTHTDPKFSLFLNPKVRTPSLTLESSPLCLNTTAKSLAGRR